MVKLQWEDLSDTFDEFHHLFNAHYKEIFNKDISVERDRLLALEEGGVLFFLTAREGGKPVGYYATALFPTVYNTVTVEAKDLGIYISPDKRKCGITTKMQEEMDNSLKELGVDSVVVSYPYESSIPTRVGYSLKEVVYGRDL